MRAPVGRFGRSKLHEVAALVHDTGSALTLRVHLRTRTSAVHDRLDAVVSSRGLYSRVGFTQFLERQLQARAAIETWADQHFPEQLRPPSMTGLIRTDLADLGHEAVADLAPALPFALARDADPLGAAWAIAGSQMGNRAILVRLRKATGAGGAAELPTRFLADTSMTEFWHRLLPSLQVVVTADEAEPAVAAAGAVFACFERAFAEAPAPVRHAA